MICGKVTRKAHMSNTNTLLDILEEEECHYFAYLSTTRPSKHQISYKMALQRIVLSNVIEISAFCLRDRLSYHYATPCPNNCS